MAGISHVSARGLLLATVICLTLFGSACIRPVSAQTTEPTVSVSTESPEGTTEAQPEAPHLRDIRSYRGRERLGASPGAQIHSRPAAPAPEVVVEAPAPAVEPAPAEEKGKQEQNIGGAQKQGVQPAPVAVPSPRTVPVYRPQSGAAVSFNFDDADVYSVVQTVLGDLLRVNYIIDPKVKGRVTFRSVAPVPRDNVLPVLEVILRLNGVGIVEEGGIFRIIQITDIAKEPAPIQFGRDPAKVAVTGKSLLQVVPILNIQSTEIIKLIGSFVSTNAVLVDVPRGNHIIIVDTDANVKRLLELVQIFDGEQFKKRKGEVYVYPIQNSKAKDVAALLQQIFMGSSSSSASSPSSGSSRPLASAAGQSGQSQPAPQPAPQAATILSGNGASLVSDMTRILYDEKINSIVVVGTPEDYSMIREAIEKIDVIPRQVVLEGVIAEVTLTDNLSLGMAYSFGLTASRFGLSGQIGLNPSTLANADPSTFTGSGFTFMGVDQKGTVRALVTALASQSKGKLLAAPHILVADNQKARIQVGQQVPIVTSETYGSTTIAPQRTIQYRDIGIILTVKPQVNEGGLVSLELDQEISTFTTQKLFSDSTEIILDKAQATTTLVVGDGQTIIIGGLIREDSNKTDSGIPFLHRVPVLGYLFGQKTKDTTRKEMIILLTPHVIKTQDQAHAVTRKYVDKFTDLGTMKKEDLESSKAPGAAAGASK